MPLSKQEQQDLIDRLLPNSGYEADPEPQTDQARSTAPAERTGDEDSLQHMYSTTNGQASAAQHAGKAHRPQKNRKTPLRDSHASQAEGSGGSRALPGDAGPAAAHDDEDEVVMLGQEDTSPGANPARASDAA